MIDYDVINSLALTIPIEKNKRIIQSNGVFKTIYYEYEAIRFVQFFRKNAGLIKDIPIYMLCPTGTNRISNKTYDILSQYGCNIIFDDNFDTDDKITFISIPYTGYFFENHDIVDSTYRLRLDLDFIVERPFNLDIFDSKILNEYVVIGSDDQFEQHDNEYQRTTFGNTRFDTGFVISKHGSNFYTRYYELCKNRQPFYTSQWQCLIEKFGDNASKFFTEEFVVDYMFYVEKHKIMPYKIGKYELYHDTSEATANINHEHIDSTNIMKYLHLYEANYNQKI